jgi:hypothetical protein
LEQRSPSRGRGVDRLALKVEIAPNRVQLSQKRDEVLQGATETIHRPGCNHIDLAGRRRLQQLVELRALVPALGAGDPVVDIQERINAGIARARQKGTKSGRPIGRPTMSKQKEAAIRAELAKGTGILKTAKLLKAGSAAVHRIKRAMAEQERTSSQPGS